MIVPSNRLILLTAVLVVPCGLLAALFPAALPGLLCAIAAFALLAAIDAVRASESLARVTAALPELARLTKGRQGSFQIRVSNSAPRPVPLRIGIALPPALDSAQETLRVNVPPAPEPQSATWTCQPRRRGCYTVEHLYLETSSPFRLWAWREKRAGRMEVRVYPNLREERTRLASVFLHRGGYGAHTHRMVGKGREFEKLREYIPGDSFEDIHWKATARRAHPITKTYQLERTQEVYAVLDTSRLCGRVVGEKDGEPITQLDRFVQAALALGLVAERQKDFFGLIVFGGQVRRFVRARGGQAHYNACRDALYTLEPESGDPDYEELCTFVRLRLRRRVLLVFLTNLDDPVLAERFADDVQLLTRQHLVLANMITPPGARPVFTTGPAEDLDAVYRRLAGHFQWRDLRALQRRLRRRGVTFSLVDNPALAPDLVAQYMQVKQRQLL